jgi:hypothetical protein
VDLRTYAECPRGFGFPSIHAVADAAFYPYLVFETYHQRKAWFPASFNRTARRRMCAAPPYSDGKVANREIRVWHFVIENGY